ncbi:hypothetical protein G6F22_019086 [Rhizopus arrhizus]|nr:hypothetical protein G6F22_019086 [Rhizopus arrhizus]
MWSGWAIAPRCTGPCSGTATSTRADGVRPAGQGSGLALDALAQVRLPLGRPAQVAAGFQQRIGALEFQRQRRKARTSDPGQQRAAIGDVGGGRGALRGRARALITSGSAMRRPCT